LKDKKRLEHDMPTLGPFEIILILVVVVLLFGVGRISKVAGEMGSGIRAFKNGLQGDEKQKQEDNAKPEDPDKQS
jgi:sec-independent protein translocase protein TatA